MTPIRIAVDAMGGDHGHDVIINGAIRAASDHPVKILLVGEKEPLEKSLLQKKYEGDSIEIIPASESISMSESPREGIESKPDSSIIVAAKLVANDRADALVSAGGTGSVVLAAAKNIPRIAGVRRTAIATVYPTMNESNRADYLS